ncbi:glutamate formimidoyltransferase [bacterium]|nr:glutamate formimidoyltransferase [bacterium]
MKDNAVVECVPNFSEGRDRKKIDAIAEAIRGVAGVKLLDIDPGADTNRTVYTFVGGPRAIVEAALSGARAARDLIDMASHSGAHPRIGALDVCPFVPVSGISIEECAGLAREFGERLAAELGVPVYLYEKAATSPARVSLADIRSGEYEGLAAKLRDPEWKPDFGPARFDARWGATVAGAREFLIAYNVNLNTRDKKLANDIALTIREGGRLAKNPDGSQALDAAGNPLRAAGRLKAVRAIGWYIEQYRCAQVSINLLDYAATPLWEVFETVREEADKRGLFVTGSELVGLIPLKALADCGRHFLSKMGKSPALPDAELIEVAARTLALDSVGDFDPRRKIVEWAYSGAGKLASMTVAGFADEVSNDTPAPGGGSVAALAGSLGAALAAMVGNLTIGKKGYEAHYEALASMAAEAQRIKGELMAAVDADTEAFDAVLEASRLPKATGEQRAARDAAMLEAGRKAAAVPMATAAACLGAMKCCAAAVERGNRNSVTDGAAGALIAKAGLDAALLNVRINLASLGDADFSARLRAEAASLAAEADTLASAIKASADVVIGG